MNNLPEGFEDLPIGFIQALYDFYCLIENSSENSGVKDIPLKNIDPDMRSAIIKGQYYVENIPTKHITAIRPSEIFNLGQNIGLSKQKTMRIIATDYKTRDNA
jgi:hypothetical protein